MLLIMNLKSLNIILLNHYHKVMRIQILMSLFLITILSLIIINLQLKLFNQISCFQFSL